MHRPSPSSSQLAVMLPDGAKRSHRFVRLAIHLYSIPRESPPSSRSFMTCACVVNLFCHVRRALLRLILLIPHLGGSSWRPSRCTTTPTSSTSSQPSYVSAPCSQYPLVRPAAALDASMANVLTLIFAASCQHMRSMKVFHVNTTIQRSESKSHARIRDLSTSQFLTGRLKASSRPRSESGG